MPLTIRNSHYPEAAVDRIQTNFAGKLIIALLCAAAFLLPARGADNNALKTIDNPGGGQIIYGPLDDQSSMKDAMVAMLRNIHGHFGDRPQIGSLFQAHGSESLATFFTVTAKTQGGKHIAGMVIVAMPAGSKPAAAVIYDDADRFGKTMNPMMKKLNEVWHVNPAGGQPAAGKGAPVQELHVTHFPDNSGTIGLPTGWKISSAAGGAVVVVGPNGEMVAVSLIHQMFDPSNPQGQGMIKYETQNGRRPLPPQFSVYPFGQDLVAAFMAYQQQAAQRGNAPIPTLNVTSKTKTGPTQWAADGVTVLGELDMHDGKGPLRSLILISAMKRVGPSQWGMMVTRVSAPDKVATEEWPTLLAIANSENQNAAVIQAQTQQVIKQIHQVGENAKRQADAAHAANDAHNASVEKQWDENARMSKSFQEYTLDQSVIVDKSTGEHATAWNQTAELLVKADPNRFQYVPNKDLLKGVDY
jgi:hypothetical protein